MTSDLSEFCKVWKYPGGEVGLRATGSAREMISRVQSSDDLLRLCMYLTAVRGQVDRVFLPYLPYARQDRIAAPGDPNALAFLAQMLDLTGVRYWITLDAHSDRAVMAFRDAGSALVSRSPVPYLIHYLRQIVHPERPLVLIAPDAGAAEKVRGYAACIPAVRDVICCRKKRDPDTGALSGFEVVGGPEKLTEFAVVVDDICDGGGTFLGVAAALRERYGAALQLHLFTSHGIYSKGLEVLLEQYQTVGSTDSFIHNQTHPRLRTIAL